MLKSNLTKEYLEKLVKDLVSLGEDEGELSIWVDLYDAMNDAEKTKLIKNLEKEIKAVSEAGADWIHVDVMDGDFVNNITIGVPVVESLKKISPLPLDVHLMIEQRHLLIAALSSNCPSGTCPTELMVELGEFKGANRSYKGAIAMFARRMQLLRQLTGFDLFIPMSAIGSEPADFCRKVNQIRLQCLDNTVT